MIPHEHEEFGMPQKMKFDGHYYEYNESTGNKSEAQRLAKALRDELGFSARIVMRKYHGYDKYHIYFRPRH